MYEFVYPALEDFEGDVLVLSGAGVSTLELKRAEAFKLTIAPAPQIRLLGVGGAAETFVARVPKLTLAGQDLHDVDGDRGDGERDHHHRELARAATQERQVDQPVDRDRDDRPADRATQAD